MKIKFLAAFLALTLLALPACGDAPTADDLTPGVNSPQPPAAATSTPAPPTSEPTLTPIPRSAEFVEIINTVDARPGAGEAFKSASMDQVLAVGGEARTGDDGRARLDILPEGSIVRIAPQSSFILQDLELESEGASSRIELFFGKLWIILKGEELQVETPNSLAAVRGSYMSVAYDPEMGQTLVSCLEGSCSLENDYGRVDLIDGQLAFVLGSGSPPEGPFPITQEEFNQWLYYVLEAWELLASEGYMPPEGMSTPGICYVCTPGVFLTGMPVFETAVPTVAYVEVPTSIPDFPTSFPFPTP